MILRLKRLESLIFTCVVGLSLLASSFAEATCQPVLPQQVEIQKQKHGFDPGVAVLSMAENLHAQFKTQNSTEPNQLYRDPTLVQNQMSAFYQKFALSTWMDRLGMVPKLKELNPFESTEVSYLFTHWVRVKYMSSVFRLVKKRELEEAYRIKGRFPAQVIEKIVSQPAHPMITGYSTFTCQDMSDNVAYDCSKKMIYVHAHLSPDVLCEISKFSKDARFKYLVQLQEDGFRVVDVEVEGRRLYKDSFHELGLFVSNRAWDKVKADLKIWSFLKPDEISDTDLQSFRNAIDLNPSRLPASQSN